MANVGYVNKAVRAMYGIPYSQLTAEQKRILHEDSKRRAKLIDEREQAVLKNNLKAFEDEAKMERVLASIYKDCQKQILADVAETMAKVKKAGGTWSYANQSALTRSRGLFEQITEELNKLGQKEQNLFYSGLSHIYTDQFLRQVYELGQSIPVKANFNRLNPSLVRKTLDYPWSGAMFSDRLWLDKETLGRNLRVGLTQSMILGEGIPEITDRITKGIETSRYNAERIARTETKRVTYVAHNDAYEDMGVKELKYYTAGMKSASKVCDICSADNGKIYKRGEEPTLPRHPNCKCVYIPVVSDTFGDNELNELTGSIRGSENYEKWRKAEEEKRKKAEKKEKTPADLIQEDVDAKVGEIALTRKRYLSEYDTLQAEYDSITAERNKYDAVRRGLEDPQTEGFASMAEFKKYDYELYNKQTDLGLALSAKDREIQLTYKLEGDLRLDVLFVGNDKNSEMRYNSIEKFRNIRTTLRENKTFEFDTYKDELVEMTKRMDEDSLLVQSKLSYFISKSDYNSGGGGKAGNTVSMTMSKNHHEKFKGYNLKGAWETKYHEEGHVLDHVLKNHADFRKAGTGKYANDTNRFMLGFMDITREYGEQACEAVEKDILAFINNAIEWSNKTSGNKYKQQKSLARISGDSKEATIEYLHYLTKTERINSAHLSALTDAIGCFTKGNLHPYRYGFWGHDGTYCKEGGKQMAVAESWATWNYVKVAGTSEERDVLERFMPNTNAQYGNIFSKVAEWLKDNELNVQIGRR